MTTQEQVKDVVSQVLADKADKGGIKRVVWIGAGGSNGGNYPAQYFMEHEATQVVSSSYTSNEFVHATPAYVNENTLAVVVSMRGTKETIVAAQVAKDHGASTIAIYVDESGLTEVCDYKIQYDSLAVDESCMGRTNSAVVTMIAMELTQQTEGYAEVIGRLDARGADYQCNTVESIGLRQIFTMDPNEVLLELNFFGD